MLFCTTQIVSQRSTLVHSALVSPLFTTFHLLTATYTLRFDPHVAHAANDIVSGLLVVFQSYYFNRVGGIMRTQDQVTIRGFDIPDYAGLILTYGIYVTFPPAVGS